MSLDRNPSIIVNRLLDIGWSFSDISGANDLYSLHPYPANYIPQLPRFSIKGIGVTGNETVFDPFCGSGTTLIEAQSLGYNSIGIELNPIACLISRVATSPQSENLKESVPRCIQFAKAIEDPRSTELPNIDHWFKKSIQKSILAHPSRSLNRYHVTTVLSQTYKITHKY